MPAGRAKLIRTEALLRELRRYRRLREKANAALERTGVWTLFDHGALSGISSAMCFVERFARNEKRLRKKVRKAK